MTRRFPRFSPFVRSIAAVSLFGIASPVRPAWAGATAAASTDHAVEPGDGEVSASVLDLDGPDPDVSALLGTALREELGRRGVGGGRAATTAEVRIALECESLDPPCLARAARLLGARRVIFGALEGEPRVLELHVFVADAARIDKSVALPLADADLEPGRISATAARAADLLFPDTAAADLPPAEAAHDEPGLAGEPAPRTEGKPGTLEWGPYSPRPRWKWATFGTSAALLGAGLVGFMITVIPVAQSNRRRGFLYEGIEQAALDSLGDSSAINDVDPATVLDMCSDADGSGGALERLGPDDGVATPGVRNIAVAQECRRAEGWSRLATGFLIFSSAMAVSTAVFTTLLFVRRVPGDRRMSLGVAPDLEGGAHVVGRVRF